MSTSKSPAFAFVVQQLEADRDVEFATVRDAAAERGFTIYPIMYGRAKAKLGLVEVAPRGSKANAKPHAKPEPKPRAPRAEPQQRNGGTIGSLEEVIAAMRAGEATRRRYRDALEKISAIIDDALAAE